jgi:hypothetical protein
LNRFTLARTGDIQPGFFVCGVKAGEKAKLHRQDSIDPVVDLSMLKEAQRELGLRSDWAWKAM